MSHTDHAVTSPPASAVQFNNSSEPTRRQRIRDAAIAVVGAVLSIAVLTAVLLQLNRMEFARLLALAPREPSFWLVFALYYVLAPLTEWVILRRLWRLPPSALSPLLRKQVANELVLGYSGDAQFYLWARRHIGFEGSLFGTLRDVTVLSALAGNLTTLVAMLVTAPLLYGAVAGPILDAFVGSTLVIIVTSLAVLALRRTLLLFAMPLRDLAITFALHCARIVLSLTLVATLWHLLVPSLALQMLVVVATMRMMIYRLPLLPARDALLAGLVLVLLGKASEVTAAIALMAGLMIIAHLAVGTVTSLIELLRREPAR